MSSICARGGHRDGGLGCWHRNGKGSVEGVHTGCFGNEDPLAGTWVYLQKLWDIGSGRWDSLVRLDTSSWPQKVC